MEANLAFLCGQVWAALARVAADWNASVPGTMIVEPVTTESGDYTNHVIVHRPSGSYSVTVERVSPPHG